ncbi:S8 family serine peptidase [Cohnella sp. AR92]|uniref:S8 family serine peptidase n=1 Tax=Cohnella sp. AR92 TaxID=648716 RepID=UPI000F8D59F2|nr:S8 family serine peptidase [Cohnella sp. AR92]RUS47878.1 hypothetical protein ELR57_04875 [Cohnella sp. AR92]
MKQSLSVILSVGMLFGSMMNPAAHAESNGPASGSLSAEPSQTSDRIIVKYKDGADRQKLYAKYALKAMEQLKLPNTSLDVLEVSPRANVSSVIDSLEQDPNVLYAEPDIQIRSSSPSGQFPAGSNPANEASSTSVPAGTASIAPASSMEALSLFSSPSQPNDPHFPEQWGLQNIGQNLPNQTPSMATWDIDMDVPEAWQITQGSDDAIVAIIDTGVEIDHPDLQDSIWTNKGEIAGNGKDDDGNGFVDDVHGWNFYGGNNSLYNIFDDDLQGTQMAGVIAAAANNEIGIAGVAPHAKIMPLKVIGANGAGYVSDVIWAIEYAERMGAKVVNISWSLTEYSQALKDAIDNSSMLFVAIAGVDYLNTKDEAPEYPAAYDSDNVLSVTGIDPHGNPINAYSVRGKNVDLSAPNTNIWTTIPTRNPGIGAQIDNGKYKVVYNGIGFESIQSDESRIAAFDRAIQYFGKAKPSILLVQDDEWQAIGSDNNYLPLYQSLLGTSGFQYDTMTVAYGDDGPSLDKLKSYDLVVWFTGDGVGLDYQNYQIGSYTTPLKEADQESLTAYLNGGGNLLLTGSATLLGNEFSPFVKDILHLDAVRNNYSRSGEIWDKAEGAPGTLNDGLSFDMFSSFTYDDMVSNDPSITTVNLNAVLEDYAYTSGFEFPAAYASGVAALIYSQYPTEDASVVKERMILNGKPFYPDEDVTASNKMVDAYKALTDNDLPGQPYIGESYSDTLDAETDAHDVYYINLHKGDQLDLTLAGDSGTDFDLHLFDPTAQSLYDTQKVAASSETRESSAESISYAATVTGTYFIDVAAYSGAGGYTISAQRTPVHQTGTYEDTDEALAFTGSWSTKTDAGHSGGTAKQLDAAGSVEFSFTGGQIEWIGYKNNEQGIADVFIDGVKVKSVSLYSESPQTQQVLFSESLPLGGHAISIKWTGKSDPAAKKSANSINIDALRVVTATKSYTVRTEEQDSSFAFYGTWTALNNENYSGGRTKSTSAKGAYVTIPFTGTKVVLLATAIPNGGKAKIMIDNRPETARIVDFYSAASKYQVAMFDSGELEYGRHTLHVMNIGEHNASSAGFTIDVDAIVVTKPSSANEVTKWYEESNPYVNLHGTWTYSMNGKYSDRSAAYTDLAGNYAELYFVGSKVSVLATTGPNRGKVYVYVDGNLVTDEPIDLYNETYRFQVPIFESAELPGGSHTIKVVNAGEKNGLSTGNYVSIDAFLVTYSVGKGE